MADTEERNNYNIYNMYSDKVVTCNIHLFVFLMHLLKSLVSVGILQCRLTQDKRLK